MMCMSMYVSVLYLTIKRISKIDHLYLNLMNYPDNLHHCKIIYIYIYK